MTPLKIHHYGFVTDSLEKTVEAFRSLGYQVEKKAEVPDRKIRLAFLSHESDPPLEIVCDTDAAGPTSKIISRRGTGLYHICYSVADLAAAMQDLQSRGFQILHKPAPASVFQGQKVAWMHNRAIGLIELLEDPPKSAR